MTRYAGQNVLGVPRLPGKTRLLGGLVMLSVLAACSSQPTRHARTQYNPTRYYPPPGPTNDRWGPYIHEASGRFGVPEVWIRRVMRQESGGQEDVISWAGAMGLMQVMPDTYDGLRSRYNLGDDPFDPHNNILAGTAYLREMYDRFGSPGFLAAYNAGPNRLDQYLNNGTPLPDETVNYVASIAPLLGPETPMSGPLAVYGLPIMRVASRATANGCDPDAAYNPGAPCPPLRPAVVQPVVTAAYVPPSGGQDACDPDAAYDPRRPCHPQTAAAPVTAYSPQPDDTPQPIYRSAVTYSPAPAPAYAARYCDPDAAYDPSRPCQPAPAAPAPIVQPVIQPLAPVLASRPDVRPLQERMAQPVAFAPGAPPGHWAIQVGAFANLATAEAAAERARAILPDVLRTAKIELPATAPFGTQVAFRARLFGLSASAAADACERLSGRSVPCITVPPPTHDSF